MSILIQSMEMPKKCLDCPFMISRDNDDCIVQSNEANAKFDSWDDMKASCPLVEIPTPHGRLGDLDELKRKAQKVSTEAWKMKLTAKVETTINQFIDWLDNAETIVEAG